MSFLITRLVMDYFHQREIAEDKLAHWLEAGELVAREDILEGLESLKFANFFYQTPNCRLNWETIKPASQVAELWGVTVEDQLSLSQIRLSQIPVSHQSSIGAAARTVSIRLSHDKGHTNAGESGGFSVFYQIEIDAIRQPQQP